LRKRVAILISGRGSNMEALIRATENPAYPAEIALVVSNEPEAAGIAKAEALGVTAIALDHRKFLTRASFEMALHGRFLDHGIELVCNAGFMRLLTAEFVNRWLDRHLNIHPSLLPAFPGLNTHERVLSDGVRITGATVHFVRIEMDSGPIIAQAAVPVLPGDDAERLGARVLSVEHHLYPHALALVASGRARVVDGSVAIDGEGGEELALFSPPLH
jgi:phosphoribosylglycinamide formyltransferase-1